MDKIFTGSLNEFINNLIVQQANASQDAKFEVRYNILMKQFEKNFRMRCTDEKVTKPEELLPLGINPFRRCGFSLNPRLGFHV